MTVRNLVRGSLEVRGSGYGGPVQVSGGWHLRADADQPPEQARRDHRRATQRDSKVGAARVRQQLADTDRRLKVQVQALEDGVEPELVSARIQELRDRRDALTAALADLAPAEAPDAEDDALVERLERIPDLTRAFRAAPFEVKRQMLDAFDVQISYDKVDGRIEIRRLTVPPRSSTPSSVTGPTN